MYMCVYIYMYIYIYIYIYMYLSLSICVYIYIYIYIYIIQTAETGPAPGRFEHAQGIHEQTFWDLGLSLVKELSSDSVW